MNFCLGKRQARHDARVPLLSSHTRALSPPPPSSNWNTEVADWKELANNSIGDCTSAAVLHLIMQQSAFANPGAGLVATDAEAIAFYSAVTGYNPADPNSDQGAYMLGPHGVIDVWTKDGITCGGVLNHPTAVLQVKTSDTSQWRQAIHTFGSLLIGLNLPENVVSGSDVPFVWSDPSGPVAGGHEVLCTAYLTVGDEVLYDVISWGRTFRCTETFLLATLDEAITVYDRISLDSRGISPAGFSEVALLADMAALRA